jgi:hypothetical protein
MFSFVFKNGILHAPVLESTKQHHSQASILLETTPVTTIRSTLLPIPSHKVQSQLNSQILVTIPVSTAAAAAVAANSKHNKVVVRIWLWTWLLQLLQCIQELHH